MEWWEKLEKYLQVTLQMILIIVEILAEEIKSGTDIVLIAGITSQMIEDLTITVTEATVNTVEIEVAVTTDAVTMETAEATVVTEAVTMEAAEVTVTTEEMVTEEMIGVNEGTTLPGTATLVMGEEIMILGVETPGTTEETVDQEVAALGIATADPETDSMEIDQGQGTEAKAVTETPQDQGPPINLGTEIEATPTIETLKGMDMTVEIGHPVGTEEVPVDTADQTTGTSRLRSLPDILVEEETDLERETDLHLERTGTPVTLEVTGTATALETDPNLEEGETVGEVTAERPRTTTNLIL